MLNKIIKKENLLFIWLLLMPFFSVSPWQILFIKPIYIGFLHYALLVALLSMQFIDDFKSKRFDFDLSILCFAAFALIAGISLFLNWHAIEGVMLENSVGFNAPHVYNIFTLVYLIFNILTVWLLSRIFITREIIKKGVNVLLAATVVTCVYGIVIALLIVAGILDPNLLTFPPRLQGSATEPQVFGNFLLIGLPLVFIRFVIDPGRYNSWLLFILSLAMVMTFSMGAWIGISIAFLFLIWHCLKRLNLNHLKILSIIIIGISLSLFAFGFICPSYFKYLRLSRLHFWNIRSEIQYFERTKKNPNIDDKLDRLWLAQSAINQFKSNLLLGVGYGNYGFLYNKFKPENSLSRPYIEKAHNAYLEILAETGIVGFIAFFSGIGLILFSGFKKIAVFINNEAKLLYLGILASCLALLIQGLSFGIFAHNYTWIALGMILGAQRLYGK